MPTSSDMKAATTLHSLEERARALREELLSTGRFKTCFTCKMLLPLANFNDNPSRYQVPAHHGKNISCAHCTFWSDLRSISRDSEEWDSKHSGHQVDQSKEACTCQVCG